LLDVVSQLGNQRVEGRVSALVSKARSEVHLQYVVIQVAVEIQEMSFDRQALRIRLSSERRPGTDVDGCRMLSPSLTVRPSGVDAAGRNKPIRRR
jgi:hypothetical protein